MRMTTRQFNYLLFCTLLAIGGILYVYKSFNSNAIYIKPYEAITETRREQRQILRQGYETPVSRQPEVPGGKESRVKKQEGYRSRAY